MMRPQVARSVARGNGGRPLGLAARVAALGGAVSFLASLQGCSLLEGSVQPLPSGTENPSYYNSPSGALAFRNTAIAELQFELPSYLLNTGLLTDELETAVPGQSSGLGGGSASTATPSLDGRVLPVGSGLTDGDYSSLQAVRGTATQAIGTLATYDSAAPPALRGELYALEGYAEILLADFFCSGVPLSAVGYQTDYTYHASSTTAQVYQNALASLDTALTLTGDSARLQNLARVLRGRAFLALGGPANLDSAAQAVAAVPDGFQYQLAVNFGNISQNLAANTYLFGIFSVALATMSDHEGGNGEAYLSSLDPRTTSVQMQQSTTNGPPIVFNLPSKYGFSGFTPFTVADWIEARLIQAEAALQAHDVPTYLAQLNHLRLTATVPGQMASLDPLTDPGAQLSGPAADTARVSLLFRERAYWLYLTGHRQGDLRRLIRQYGRRQDQVYPTGPGYGSDVTAPIPQAEYDNPLFHGCLDRNA
jgi:hypothetical protein